MGIFVLGFLNFDKFGNKIGKECSLRGFAFLCLVILDATPSNLRHP